MKQSAAKTIVVFLAFHLVYLVLPLGFVAVPLYLLRDPGLSRALGTAWIVSYFAWAAATRESERQLGRPWPWFENLGIWSWLFSYFPFAIERAQSLGDKTLLPPLKADGLYIFGLHPHGALAFNRGMFGFSTSTLWFKAFPGVQFRVLAATAALRVPVIREMWLWSYCIDASKAVARRALKSRTSLVLYPGGEKEQMMTVRGKHHLYLNSRKGFVKLALENNASLVPTYIFGETDLFNHSAFLLGPRIWLMKNFGVAVPLIYGAAGLLPYSSPVTAVVGKPLAPPARPAGESPTLGGLVEPSQAEIDDFHSRYVAALTELFERHKVKYGYPDAVLEIQ